MRTAQSALAACNGPDGVNVVRAHARAFSLIDVLVSMAVITVLISLLLPSLAPVKETARQVACRSGIRQIGIGIAMFADDHQDWIPKSQWASPPPPAQAQPAQTVCLTFGGKTGYQWDGLGILYHEQYLGTPGSFYCPSHTAEYKFSDQTELWHNPAGIIVGNYQYRAAGPKGHTSLTDIEPKRSALVSDSLRSRDEYNHGKGANVLRADLSVYWYADHAQTIFAQLGKDDGVGPPYTGAPQLTSIWNSFDEGR